MKGVFFFCKLHIKIHFMSLVYVFVKWMKTDLNKQYVTAMYVFVCMCVCGGVLCVCFYYTNTCVYWRHWRKASSIQNKRISCLGVGARLCHFTAWIQNFGSLLWGSFMSKQTVLILISDTCTHCFVFYMCMLTYVYKSSLQWSARYPPKWQNYLSWIEFCLLAFE